MAKSALQAAQDRAQAHGIAIAMQDDYLRDVVVVRGRLGDIAYDYQIGKRDILSRTILDAEALYASAYNHVIDKLTGSSPPEDFRTQNRIADLENELAKYKAAVKSLSFQLEMAERGGTGVMLKEDEVRRLALEQAAEHLMDHGVITTGNELVAVCEQIKKLQRTELSL